MNSLSPLLFVLTVTPVPEIRKFSVPPVSTVTKSAAGNLEALRVDSSQRLLIGQTANVHSLTDKV